MRWVRTVGVCCIVAVLAAGLRLAAPAARAQEFDRESVLQELFLLNRRLEEARTALADLEVRLDEAAAREEEARAELERLQADLARLKAQYGRRLQYYREQGNRGFWFLLFSSKSLPDMLWRLDALQQIMDHDARKARELMATQATVEEEAQRLVELQIEAERLRETQVAQVAELEAAIAEREAILAGLGDQRAEVEEELAAVEDDWQSSAMPVLEALGLALQEIGTGGLEPDNVRFSLFPPGAVATVSADSLNEVLLRYPELAGLHIAMDDEEDLFLLSGVFDAVPLEIAGGFAVLPDGKLRFEPSLLQVRDFSVPGDAVAQIVAGGFLDIDVGPMVQPLKATGIEVIDGALIIRAGLL